MSALRLRLFVADRTPSARRAVESVETGLEARFAGAYELEVVDVLADPVTATREGVFVTPTW